MAYILNPEYILSIVELYDLIAEELYGKTFDHYDCTKVSVGEGVYENIRRYYIDKGEEDFSFNMIWVCYGPKATLTGYNIEVEEGWCYDD